VTILDLKGRVRVGGGRYFAQVVSLIGAGREAPDLLNLAAFAH